MTPLFLGLGGGVSPRTLLFVGVLVAIVIVNAVLYDRIKRKDRQKPGMQLSYDLPGQTEAGCRTALEQPLETDLLACALEPDRRGGWMLHFLRHNATQQPLDTVYSARFEQGDPARLTLTFESEAFGMREPVLPEDLLDDYFAAKLGAVRVKAETTEEGRS